MAGWLHTAEEGDRPLDWPSSNLITKRAGGREEGRGEEREREGEGGAHKNTTWCWKGCGGSQSKSGEHISGGG